MESIEEQKGGEVMRKMNAKQIRSKERASLLLHYFHMCNIQSQKNSPSEMVFLAAADPLGGSCLFLAARETRARNEMPSNRLTNCREIRSIADDTEWHGRRSGAPCVSLLRMCRRHAPSVCLARPCVCAACTSESSRIKRSEPSAADDSDAREEINHLSFNGFNAPHCWLRSLSRFSFQLLSAARRLGCWPRDSCDGHRERSNFHFASFYRFQFYLLRAERNQASSQQAINHSRSLPSRCRY